MTDRPIIFSGGMVKALLREVEAPGTGKTMTRRPAWDAKGGPTDWQKVRPGDRLWVREAWRVSRNYDGVAPRDLPPRKMTVMFGAGGSIAGVVKFPSDRPRPAADYLPDPNWPTTLPDWAGRLRPSIHMPRWASRLTLLVSAVRVERLQDISEEDAIAEGIYRVDPTPEEIASGECTPDDFVFMAPGTRRGYGLTKEDRASEQWGPNARFAFRLLWQSLHGQDAWDANPWIVALRFRPVLANIDSIKEAA